MKATFEIEKGKFEVIEGIKNIVELMYYEGIDTVTLLNGKTLEVYGNGTYEIY